MKKFWKELLGCKQGNNAEENTRTGESSDSERHLCLYYLEYKFIPTLVAEVSAGKLPHNAILQTSVWETYIKESVDKNFFLEWDELQCEGCKIDETYVMALYIFPTPRKTPEAAFGAVLINTKTNNATYYTLESSFGGNWVLGSTTLNAHYNLGNLPNPELKSFIDWVVKKAKDTEPVIETTFPEDNN